MTSSLLELVTDFPVRRFQADELVLEQGHSTGLMLVLLQGEVEILRDSIRVATASKPGVVFGEMSALLGVPHSASVRTCQPSSFAVIEQPREFLEQSAKASLFVAELLAQRLTALTQYLVDVKRQYEGHDHLGMVDEVLETLLHRVPRPDR
jgi:CRP/FNR family cyclic AMP-dependent transcriptional regulator